MRCRAMPPVALALALALCVGAHASVADLEVSPVRVDLSPRARSAVVAIRNPSAETARYQVKVFAWEQTRAGEMKLSPTQEVVAAPATVQLGAGETRNLRVSALGGFGAIEKSYRVSIEELPPPAKPDEATRVPVLSRVGIPVFLAPAKADDRAVLEGLSLGGGKVRFSLRAVGTVHVRPSAVNVSGVGADGATVFQKAGDTWYVLAGEQRQYELTVPPGPCAATRTVRVDVTLASGPLHAEIAAPQGACGPE